MAKRKVKLTYERTFEADFGGMRDGHIAALAMATEDRGDLGGWALHDIGSHTDDWKVTKVEVGSVKVES